MVRLSTGYMDAGQMHIGRQTMNLLHGALILSASWQRQSIQDACEAVRRDQTSATCQWGADSVYHAKYHVLLNPLTGKPQFSMRGQGLFKKKRHFTGSYDTMTQSRLTETTPTRFINTERERGDMQIQRTFGGPKRIKMGVCRYWAKGEVCKHGSLCRFSHSCSQCGSTQVHDPVSCSGMASASMSGQRT